MINEIIQITTEKMRAIVDLLSSNLEAILPKHVEIQDLSQIDIKHNGELIKLERLAKLVMIEENIYSLKAFDVYSTSSIERSIRATPIEIEIETTKDGLILRIPHITASKKQIFLSSLSIQIEDARTAIRNIRRDANLDLRELEKEQMISAVELKKGQNSIQELTDRFIASIESLGEAKEKKIDSY